MVFIGLVPSAYAKEEVVYTKMLDEGETQSVTVVNSFELENESKKDYGDYKSVSNLSNLEEIEFKNGEVTLPKTSGRFYYQGVLNDNNTPWRIDVTYKLDGNKLSRDEILGKSGKFELEMRVEKNEKVDTYFFDNYMLQASFYFDPDRYKILESDSGLIASSGSRNMVTITNLPGKEGSYTITADVEEAEFEEVQMVGIPFSMSVDTPDFDSLTGKLGDLEDGISDINSGVGELSSGIGELYYGSGELSCGIDLINVSGEKLSNGAKEFSGGLKEFYGGLNQYVFGVNEFATNILGLSDLVTSIDRLSSNYNEFDTNLNVYINGVSAMVDSLTTIKGGIDSLLVGMQGVSSAFALLEQSGSNLLEGANGISYLIGQINASAQAFQLPQPSDIAQLRNLLTQIEARRDGIASATSSLNIGALRTSLDASSANLTSVRNSLSEVNSNILTHSNTITTDVESDLDSRMQNAKSIIAAQIASIDSEIANIDTVSTSLDNLDASFNNLNVEIATITAELDGLITGLETIDYSQIETLKATLLGLQSSYSDFLVGLNEYIAGVNTLGDKIDNELIPRLSELSLGLEEVASGGDVLQYSGGEISNASNQIKYALNTMNVSLQDSLEEVGNLTDAVNRLKYGGGELTSGYDLILDSSDNLVFAVEEFSEGIKDYSYGFNQFAFGLEKLYCDGALSLSSGTEKLAEETTGMGEKVKNEIDSAIEEFSTNNDEIISFTSNKNKETTRVQFVYMMDSLKIEKEEVVEEVKEEKTFFEKLMDLF